MQAKDIMTPDPCCCAQDDTLRDCAKMMVDFDCGEIPVTDAQGNPIGVITDRDICCRAVAKGMDTNNARVGDVMTTPAITVSLSDSEERCIGVMEEHMIRRVPVVDENGIVCGIVAQADIAKRLAPQPVSHLLREVSEPTDHASRLFHNP
jgi:CBS domain-containing protein